MTSEISSPLEGAVPVAWIARNGIDALLSAKERDWFPVWTSAPFGEGAHYVPLYAAPSHPPASAVPQNVRDAVERMCSPLDSSRLSGVTAEQDALCMALIKSFIDSLGGPASAVMGEVRMLTTEEHYALVRGPLTGETLVEAAQRKFMEVNAGKTIPAANEGEKK